ncbi:ATP-dependent DNA ligase [Nocardioides salsibiostraticola]
MHLSDLVATSQTVSQTRSRKAKTEALASLLSRVDPQDPEEVRTVVSYLAGSLRQRRTGLGMRGVSSLPPPAETSSLGVVEVHETFESISALAGPGSQAARADAVADLFGRATQIEQTWLRGLVTGEVRQGALDSLVQDGLAKAGGVPVTAVRRAAMLAGSTVAIAVAALAEGEDGLARFGLKVGRPVQPMLASSAPTVAEAVAKIQSGDPAVPVAVDTKLDGIRIQVHRHGDDVQIATRSLDDITSRLPGLVEFARSLSAESFVLDGEALSVDDEGRPRAFQDTASSTSRHDGDEATQAGLAPYFFDLLHLDGRDLLDSPGSERTAALDALIPEAARVPRLVTADPEAAESFAQEAVAAGHEGVVVKSLDATYAAGRRGSGWIKVKPVHTLDLVVLAVEWGSGRRNGWLSNIHLGARDPDGGLVMVGKTFKGMTDETLAWQTERFTELATEGTGSYVVPVRPEQVVEIAIDGAQRSTRYPGGVALRFARVVRYREDKGPDEADTIGTVQSFL